VDGCRGLGAVGASGPRALTPLRLVNLCRCEAFEGGRWTEAGPSRVVRIFSSIQCPDERHRPAGDGRCPRYAEREAGRERRRDRRRHRAWTRVDARDRGQGTMRSARKTPSNRTNISSLSTTAWKP